MTTVRERYVGALLGLAVGDALGTTLEFTTPGQFEPIADMVGGGPFGLRAGQWTDDTSMALCLAESLVETGGFDPVDQLRRYARWYKEGYWSSTGRCFDIGRTTRLAIQRFRKTGDPVSELTAPDTAGNGSLMRLAPVPLFFASNPAEAVRLSGESSRTTHGARTAIDACRYFGGLLVGAVAGRPKAELLGPCWSPVEGLFDREPLAPEVAVVANGSYLRKAPPQIRGRGYVVDCLEAALWAFASTDDFERGGLAAVNLGEDADTTAAVYGQIAGAFYGVEAIPARWRERVARGEEIVGLAERLYECATAVGKAAGGSGEAPVRGSS